jgi:flagellar assembly protein FliH
LQTGSNKKNETSARIEIFRYQAGADEAPLPEWTSWGEDKSENPSDSLPAAAKEVVPAVDEAALRVEFDRRMNDESRKAFDAGRERGRLEGRQTEHEAHVAAQAAADEQRKRQVAELMENFIKERDRFLQKVEHEVVELAMGVAARVLRREAQMGPLLLTGAVRVALGQLAGSTQVRLRVPATELDLWTEAMALLPNLAVKPVVVPGDGMRLGDCMIETEMGSVDLGIRSQLGEIERGFFDRAGGRRPETRDRDDAVPAGREVRG